MKKMRHVLLLLAVLMISTVSAIAQRTITGRVNASDTKEGLLGASVAVKGTNKGTSTDIDGNYSVAVAEGGTLVFSYVGYATQEVSIGASNTVDITMDPSAGIGDVLVVGQRVPGRTNTQSAVAVDVITPKELKGFSQVDVSQILNMVAPSFNSNRQTVADGTDHVDPASLRGLGPDQVLVLVNGKRRHTSALVNINGTVGRGAVGTDMNVIPVASIERIEVLRDGAAAQYGSDAIAGVINIVLKKDFQGFGASVTTGLNVTNMKYKDGAGTAHSHRYNDGQVLQVDLMKGFKIGKGGLTLSGQYNEHGATNRSGIDNIPTSYLGNNGSFPATPTGQVEADFRKGLIAADAAVEKANGYNRQNMIFGNSSARNIGVFLNGSYPVGPGEVYLSGGITNRTGKGTGNYRPAVARNQQPLKADGSLFYPNGFLPAIESTINDQSVIVGYKMKLSDWNFDISNTYGLNTFAFKVSNSGNASLPKADAQQTTFDAGKLQFDQNTTNFDVARLFKGNEMIKDIGVAVGAEYRRDHYQIRAGELNSYFSDPLNKVPTAPLTAGGAAQGTTATAAGAQVFPGYQSTDAIDKSRTNTGVYGDVQAELFNRLLVATAVRFENYSDFGSNVSGKISSRLRITDQIALRGSYSTGFRAPSLHQRYFQNTSTQFVSGLPSNTLTVNNDNDIARVKIGVEALKPETSENASVGVTAKLGPVSLTVDAYQIKIKDRIVYSGAFSRTILDFAATEYVGISNVNFFANAANTTTKGIDVVLSTKLKLGKGMLGITGSANFNDNKVTSINSTPVINNPAKNDPTKSPDDAFKNKLFDRQQVSRIEVWQPRNKQNLSLTYSIGKLGITARTVRFGESQYVHNVDTEAKKADGTFWNATFSRDANGAAYIEQTFKPVFVTDLVIDYKVINNLNVSLGANNILDVYPDQIYIDPRNAYGSVNYSAGRDASNRGRLLFQPNQGGYNGRFVFVRLAYTMQ
jgi:iron complex outermembrane receptor protein